MSKYNGLSFNSRIKRKYESRENNNCYTYAINQPINPYTKRPYADYDYCQPGYLGGKGESLDFDYTQNIKDSKNKRCQILNLARKDLRKLGYKLLRTTYEKYIRDKDCWKVALCLSSSDYHWYRQNDDGTWSNKKGAHKVTNKDYSGEIIHNPETCDRGKYTTFVGFYVVKKIKGVEGKCA